MAVLAAVTAHYAIGNMLDTSATERNHLYGLLLLRIGAHLAEHTGFSRQLATVPVEEKPQPRGS